MNLHTTGWRDGRAGGNLGMAIALNGTPERAGEAPRLTVGLAVAIVVGTIALALPRFGHTTPDSVYYTDLLRYFQGDLPRETLHTPFAFRWVVPALASLIPGVAPTTALALCSLVATIGAYLLAAQCWAGLLEKQSQLTMAATLLVLSFPTINYASAALTDGAGFLVLAAACHSMVRHRYLRLGVILVVGAGVRESTLLMLPVLWLYACFQPRPRLFVAVLAISIATLLAALAGRWYFADLPAYFWTPSWPRFAGNMARPVSWATVGLTLGPLTVLFLAGKASPLPVRLRAFVMAVAVPCAALMLCAMVSAFMSGRFCWPLYLALVPMVAWRLLPGARDTN